MVYKTRIEFSKGLCGQEHFCEFPFCDAGDFIQVTDVNGNIFSYKKDEVVMVSQIQTNMTKDND